jgi:hypothetical protein
MFWREKMKKVMKIIRLSFLTAAFALTAFTAVANAAGYTVENPDIKIIIDGKTGTYKDIPVTSNDRTMLPLREVLINLGVKNDSQHIIWDSKKKSVTIKKDSRTIYLEVGNKTAYVNGTPFTLDAAPIIYEKNNRTYMPARFIAESLGKKVIWDGSVNAVLIRDESEINEIREILTKSQQAMETVKKYKYDMNIGINVADEMTNGKFDIGMIGEFDTDVKDIHLSMDMGLNIGMNVNSKSELYVKDNVMYMNSTDLEGWQKKTLNSDELSKVFDINSNLDVLDTNDMISAGLVKYDGHHENEIILKGDVYLEKLIRQALQSSSTGVLDLKLDKFYVELSIDRNTNLINSVSMKFGSDLKSQGGAGSMAVDVAIVYNGYNDQLQIRVPQEAIDAAVDI